MKNSILKFIVLSIITTFTFSSCSDYLEQDAGELNTIDKIFASEVETKKMVFAHV